MRPCQCQHHHEPAPRIVVTGGPGAGKTATLELLRHALCRHVRLVPESAGILFRGGFPRGGDAATRRAAQRAIFFVQRELESTAEAGGAAVLLCDRGTVDGVAYWPGPGELFAGLGTSLDEQLRRYHAVIHLRTPAPEYGFTNDNPLRVESAVEAAEIDERIASAWALHPRRFVVEAAPDFLAKVRRAVELIVRELPGCCAAAALREPS